MIEIKATTDKDNMTTGTEVSVNANGLEYMAEVESLMKGLRDNDDYLHSMVLKVLADHPHILLGISEDSDKAKEFERFVATTKFGEGVN